MQNPVNADVDAYILPIIFGFLHVQHTFANHKALTVALISRRSRHRVGTRFFSRGIDANGNVSNFNETEQLLLIPSIAGQKWMSYVQTRGSIPVFWAEVMDLKYKPKLRIFGQIDKAVFPAFFVDLTIGRSRKKTFRATGRRVWRCYSRKFSQSIRSRETSQTCVRRSH
jgi:hypothetical protein